jgi:hypothetical protein
MHAEDSKACPESTQHWVVRANYDVSPDGTRFLVITSLERPQLNVVSGWLGELRARQAARR